MAQIDLFVDVRKDEGIQTALFRATSTGSFPEGEVSLSRKPDHCFYSIDNLPAHDGHAPGFKSSADLESYIKRVATDVGKICLDANEACKANQLRFIGSWQVGDNGDDFEF